MTEDRAHDSHPPAWTRGLDRWSVALPIWAAFAALCCFANVGGHGLQSMEGIVTEGARAMLEDGDWAVPRLYGELYTYKPPLAYWMSAAAQALGGRDSEWVLRAPFALAGLLLGFVVLLAIGRRLGPRVGLLASAATVGSVIFIEKIRFAEFDVPLAFGVGVATVAACLNLTRERASAGLWLVAYGGLSIGFLAKGVPALMAYAPGLVVAALWNRRLGALVCWRHLSGVALLVAVAGGYLWWALATGGPEVLSQPLLEAQRRGGEWTPRALLLTVVKPAEIVVAFLPWSLSAAALPWTRPWRRDDLLGALWRCSAGFVVGGAVAFMAVPSHEMRYFLPLATAHAITAAITLELLLGLRLRASTAMALRGFVLVVAAAAALIAGSAGVPGWLVVVALSLPLGGFAVAAIGRRGDGWTIAMTAVTLILAVTHATVLTPRRAAARDLEATAARFRAHLEPGETVWVAAPADAASKHSSLYHHLGHPVRTFTAERPPPPGSAVIRVQPGPRSRVEPSPDVTLRSSEIRELASVDHGLGVFRLIETGSRDSSAPGGGI